MYFSKGTELVGIRKRGDKKIQKKEGFLVLGTTAYFLIVFEVLVIT